MTDSADGRERKHPEKENHEMTFKDAVKALDAEGVYGAKRPSMLGYAFKETLPGEAEGKGTPVVHIVAPDGSKTTITLEEDMRSRVFATGVESAKGATELTVEALNALALADDWELADRAELEKARAGKGTM